MNAPQPCLGPAVAAPVRVGRECLVDDGWVEVASYGRRLF